MTKERRADDRIAWLYCVFLTCASKTQTQISQNKSSARCSLIMTDIADSLPSSEILIALLVFTLHTNLFLFFLQRCATPSRLSLSVWTQSDSMTMSKSRDQPKAETFRFLQFLTRLCDLGKCGECISSSAGCAAEVDWPSSLLLLLPPKPV